MTESRSISADLVRRRTRLVPLRLEDAGWLRSAEIDTYLAYRWRHRGVHPSPIDFASNLWAATFLNFVVFDTSNPGAPLGLISAYDIDQTSLHCKVAAASFTKGGHRHTFRGTLLTINYLFCGWPFDKIYFEVPGFNVGQFTGGLSRWLTEEGSLRRHLYFDEQLWDLHILALYRSAWNAWTDRARSINETGATWIRPATARQPPGVSANGFK